MSTKRVYRRINVKKVSSESLNDLALQRGGAGSSVGLDVAKGEIVVVIRWSDGSFERPWSVKNPTEIGLLVNLLLMLRETCDGLVVAMESTGNYSEAVRRAMTEAFLDVQRVSGKAVSDYKEIFDGVPSQHDGKDAAMIAELAAFGKGTAWPYRAASDAELEIKHQVQRLDAFRGQANQWLGRLEGCLARHWPELSGLLELSSVTLRKIISHYGSPSALARDSQAGARLRSWGRGYLRDSKIAAIIESARTSVGLPISAAERAWLQEIVAEVNSALQSVKDCEKRLKQLAADHQVMSNYAERIGAATLCVIWSTVGDPIKYSSSGAFIKALGLNLKELSSGQRKGELAVSKRGPGLARKWIYYWALRAVQTPELKNWYRDFQKIGGQGARRSSEHRAMKGLIAMMRKLCRGLWYARVNELPFDNSKVFPGEPLEKIQQPNLT